MLYFNQFKVNEAELRKMSKDEVRHIKKHFLKALDRYKQDILKNIEYDYKSKSVVYKKDAIFNFKEVLENLRNILGKEVVSELNIAAFLGKISQIIEFKKRDTIKRIREEFENYEKSFDYRVHKPEVDEGDGHFDQYEEETSKIPRKTYELEKYQLDIELSKLQKWVEKSKSKVCMIFEGRDSAGKGSAIKRFVERMNPRVFKVVALGMPTDEEKIHWFERYERHLPKPGEVTLFDRSWYNRAVVEPACGYCTEDQYNSFMENVLDWEEDLIDRGFILIKFWFSITKDKQKQRFEIRQKSPIKYWKYSPNDAAVVDKWDIITKYKNIMFNKTSSLKSPWVIVNSNDKRIGRLNSIRYALSQIPYTGKNDDVLNWYPEVITVVK